MTNKHFLFSSKDEGEYQSPEDAYAFGKLLVYMFANWSFAWKLNFFPMSQVERYVLKTTSTREINKLSKIITYFKVYKEPKTKT